MRALTITHRDITRDSLLRIAEEIPGARIGLRIAGYLLVLSGWRSSQVAELFGLTRCGVVKWIRKANQMGLEAVRDRPRSGRPALIDQGLMKELDQVLSRPPKEVGIARSRWDGVVVVEYLDRVHRIKIHVRHAQRLIRKLGYSLRRPIYRYVQASEEGVPGFWEELKKTPSRPQKQGPKGRPF
ncbi:hypothetical protein HKBW3S03_01914 [Candidatus Hakubella thermalkaliphila]|uniref:Winged helix-turn helix domain-containing protein n=3 Tax=Candidatus Hakubella thermalkaliphila TaxID=2754717 RepID=A0A6V8NJB5_9ACTN|nr:helix-turn-helix domain-containing protein [Candidatus Hakubella thermalkaliphila]GFP20412.1 hypothetical protein HKBW3S03_01914 [Candidatus Hakubella thermalkaliphila]GFP21426.1 hypothetical protein HKBW3S06_00653 [Candidatus Hakubella thermalkaliphila]GFP23738.1 hypothetical protein HKBW3S09_01203 [Candidatus Hakubella thermalkaliphila]GFP25195.1 hypothetical protein HKBW3S25_00653 [Candidatus Hakubella thermalkaliphila]GFP28592.1 hypothetical protein HKBW3S33_02006 [Candidatus Hakubella 